MDARVEESLRRAALWDEVKDKLGIRASAFPAASSSGCASRAASRSKPEVLLLDEPASALDPVSTAKLEETHRRAEEGLHDRHRDPQSAAGDAGLGQHRLHVLGRLIEFAPTTELFSTPRDQAHRRLHRRPLRLAPPLHLSRHPPL